MVIETFRIMASIAVEISLVLFASDRSNEPHLPKAMRKKNKLTSKSNFPHQHFSVILQKEKTDQFT